MSILNGIFNAIGDVLFAPLSGAHPVIVIFVLAVLMAAGSLLVFKWTSNQEKIRAGKGPMKAHLLGVAIFRHDLRQVFRALGLSLLRSLLNMRFLLLPMAVMIVPLVLLFVQFEVRFGLMGLTPGESSAVRVAMKPGSSLDDVELIAGEGIRVETPGVRVTDPEAGLHEVDFRIRALTPGDHDLSVRAGGRTETKTVSVGTGSKKISPIRPASGLDAVFYPVEAPLDGDGPLAAIEISHQPASYPFLGIDWAWWVLFLVFMILALFVLRGPLGVDF